MACGAGMILINMDRDETMMVRGSEHHTFNCSECHDVSWHLVFIRHSRESDNAPMPAHAPPIVPDSTRKMHTPVSSYGWLQSYVVPGKWRSAEG
jgi:hypothetical protein